MSKRLFVAVLGHRNSGKSTTWNTLFGMTVRTGKHPRRLELYGSDCVDVFIISGSPEERDLYAGDLLANQDCRIVLCSIQYTEAVRRTLDFVASEGFTVFVQWLNPGFEDASEYNDRLGLVPWLVGHGATVVMRSGQVAPVGRSEEIRQFIHGWAKAHRLTFA